ncbi:hypothetical protein CR513_36049, partial [Mucuna pruriens]
MGKPEGEAPAALKGGGLASIHRREEREGVKMLHLLTLHVDDSTLVSWQEEDGLSDRRSPLELHPTVGESEVGHPPG